VSFCQGARACEAFNQIDWVLRKFFQAVVPPADNCLDNFPGRSPRTRLRFPRRALHGSLDGVPLAGWDLHVAIRDVHHLLVNISVLSQMATYHLRRALGALPTTAMGGSTGGRGGAAGGCVNSDTPL
jgi:hypothetical protein